MKILALDQARAGGWSLFDNGSKELLAYGEFDFSGTRKTYAETISEIRKYFAGLVEQYRPDMVLFEDIQYRLNIVTFKKLAWLQGALIDYCVENELMFWLVQPAKWQAWCKKHCDAFVNNFADEMKASKQLSIHYVRYKYGIETKNDNLADAVCIGSYGVNAEDLEFDRN